MLTLLNDTWKAVSEELIFDAESLKRIFLEQNSELKSNLEYENELLNNPGDIRKYLADPFLFRDMQKAVDLIKNVAADKGRIIIHGDYDVDGMTSSTILLKAFEAMNCNCEVFIPDRLYDGYGVNMNTVAEIKKNRPDLFVTVDCGSSANEEIIELKKAGVPVIVTDHHEISENITAADAHINPSDLSDNYPFKYLAGVGVAYALVRALGKSYADDLAEAEKPDEDMLRIAEYLNDDANSLPFVALGTVADAVALYSENRAMVKAGLLYYPNYLPAGLRALCDKAMRNNFSVSPVPLTAEFLAFKVIPALNAAGRLGVAEKAMQLLLCDDIEEAPALATELYSLNVKRKKIQNDTEIKASAMVSKDLAEGKGASNGIIVKAADDWHIGVLGIVSAKLREKYHMPALIMTRHEDIFRGSCRSCGDFDWFKMLSQVSEHCLTFGGHKAAAGVSVSADKLDDFIEALYKAYEEYEKAEADSGEISADYDYLAEIDASCIKTSLVREIEDLGPYGKDCENPLFLIKGLELAELLPRGAQKNHLKLSFNQPGTSVKLRGMFFSAGEEYKHLYQKGDKVDILTYIKPEYRRMNNANASAHAAPGKLMSYKNDHPETKVNAFALNVVSMRHTKSHDLLYERPEIADYLYRKGFKAAEIAEAMQADIGDMKMNFEEMRVLYPFVDRLGKHSKRVKFSPVLLSKWVEKTTANYISPFAVIRILDVLSETGILKLIAPSDKIFAKIFADCEIEDIDSALEGASELKEVFADDFAEKLLLNSQSEIAYVIDFRNAGPGGAKVSKTKAWQRLEKEGLIDA